MSSFICLTPTHQNTTGRDTATRWTFESVLHLPYTNTPQHNRERHCNKMNIWECPSSALHQHTTTQQGEMLQQDEHLIVSFICLTPTHQNTTGRDTATRWTFDSVLHLPYTNTPEHNRERHCNKMNIWLCPSSALHQHIQAQQYRERHCNKMNIW